MIAGSEVQFEANLFTAAQVDLTVGLPEARVSFWRNEIREASWVRPVEGVEKLGDDSDRCATKGWETLFQTEVDVTIGEAPGLLRIDRTEERPRNLACRKTEAL